MILVSSSRNARLDELPESDLARVIAAKRRGEENLRMSGLGYTVIRPGALLALRLLAFAPSRTLQPLSGRGA